MCLVSTCLYTTSFLLLLYPHWRQDQLRLKVSSSIFPLICSSTVCFSSAVFTTTENGWVGHWGSHNSIVATCAETTGVASEHVGLRKVLGIHCNCRISTCVERQRASSWHPACGDCKSILCMTTALSWDPSPIYPGSGYLHILGLAMNGRLFELKDISRAEIDNKNWTEKNQCDHFKPFQEEVVQRNQEVAKLIHQSLDFC